MLIRQATKKDIENIMPMIKRVVSAMRKQGNEQWDQSYPSAVHYQKDVERGELFVCEQADQIVGVCTISSRGHEEYPLISWSAHEKSWTIKRLAVDPEQQGKGITDQFFRFIELLAKQKDISYLNTDTFADNRHAQRLFTRNGFAFVQARRNEQDQAELYYYEKHL